MAGKKTAAVDDAAVENVPVESMVEHTAPPSASTVGDYRDMADKPDPGTVAQIQVVD